jgi:hypothetical protein
VCAYLTAFLAAYPRSWLDRSLAQLPLPPVAVPHNQAIALLLSQAAVAERRLDDKRLLELARRLAAAPALTVDTAEAFGAALEPLVDVLRYATGLRSVSFGGRAFPNFWKRIGAIVAANPHIRALEVADVARPKHFKNFLTMLRKGNAVTDLAFTDVRFDADMVAELLTQLPALPVTRLRFFSPQFASAVLPQVALHPGCFASLRALVVSDEELQLDSMRLMVRAVANSPLDSLAVRDIPVDTAAFFCAISEVADAMRIAELDLTGTTCGAAYAGDARFPDSLATLRLSYVTWEKESLATLLGKQVFPEGIAIDCSRAILSKSQISHLVKGLTVDPPGSQITAIVWNDNPLFVRLMRYFSRLPNLTKLYINRCSIPKGEVSDIIAPLIEVISVPSLVKFKAISTFAELKPYWLLAIKDALAQHPALAIIDISGNPIGDEGMSALLDVLSRNPRISALGCDGMGLSSHHKLIDFFNFLASRPSLRKVKPPKKEIARLTSRCGQKARLEMKAMWKRLHAQIAASQPQGNSTKDESETDLSTIGTSDSPLGAQSLSSPLREASWVFDAEIPCDSSAQEWERLRTRFSYEAITGVAVAPPATVAPRHVRAASSPSVLRSFTNLDLEGLT